MRPVYVATFTLAPRAHPASAAAREPVPTPRPRSGRAVRRAVLAAPAVPAAPTSVREQVIERTRRWLDDIAGEHGAAFPPDAEGGIVTGDEQDTAPDGVWRATLEHPYWHPDLSSRTVRQCIEVEVAGGDVPGNACLFTLRIGYEGAAGTLAAGVPITPPSLVVALLDAFSAASGSLPLSAAPEWCAEDAVPLLVTALTDPNRATPVVVISKQPDQTTLVDPEAIARALAGVAQVVELADFAAAFPLSAELSNQLSCFNGAVRIYWPGFTRESNMYAHHLWLPDKLKVGTVAERIPDILLHEIAERIPLDEGVPPAPTAAPTATGAIWEEEQREPPVADWVTPEMLRGFAAFTESPPAAPPLDAAEAMPPPLSPLSPPLPEQEPEPEPPIIAPIAPIPPIPPVVQAVPTPVPPPPALREDAGDAPERAAWEARFAAFEAARAAREALFEKRLMEQYLPLLAPLNDKINNLQARLRFLEEDNKRIQRDNATLRDALGAKFRDLDVSYVAARESPTDAVGPQARVLDDLLDASLLAQENFGGPHVVFLDSALESADASPLQRSAVPRGYEYIRAVCEIAKRVHTNTLGTGFDQAFDERGIVFKSDISKTAATRHGKHYTFRWKQEDGTTREIMAGPHIGFGRGGVNDSIRIYWYYDKEGKRFVLCHIGRHLPDEST